MFNVPPLRVRASYDGSNTCSDVKTEPVAHFMRQYAIGSAFNHADKAPSLNYYGNNCPSVTSYKNMSKLSNKQKCNLINEYSSCGFTWDGLIPQPAGVDYCGTLDDEDN